MKIDTNYKRVYVFNKDTTSMILYGSIIKENPKTYIFESNGVHKRIIKEKVDIIYANNEGEATRLQVNRILKISKEVEKVLDEGDFSHFVIYRNKYVNIYNIRFFKFNEIKKDISCPMFTAEDGSLIEPSFKEYLENTILKKRKYKEYIATMSDNIYSDATQYINKNLILSLLPDEKVYIDLTHCATKVSLKLKNDFKINIIFDNEPLHVKEDSETDILIPVEKIINLTNKVKFITDPTLREKSKNKRYKMIVNRGNFFNLPLYSVYDINCGKLVDGIIFDNLALFASDPEVTEFLHSKETFRFTLGNFFLAISRDIIMSNIKVKIKDNEYRIKIYFNDDKSEDKSHEISGIGTILFLEKLKEFMGIQQYNSLLLLSDIN